MAVGAAIKRYGDALKENPPPRSGPQWNRWSAGSKSTVIGCSGCQSKIERDTSEPDHRMNESERNELILAKLTEIDQLIGETREMFHDEATGILATIDRIEASLQRTNELMRERVAHRKELSPKS